MGTGSGRGRPGGRFVFRRRLFAGSHDPGNRLSDLNIASDLAGNSGEDASAGDSTSITALSVSISRSGSPFVTRSPSCFRQAMSLPVSCAISRAGITTLKAIVFYLGKACTMAFSPKLLPAQFLHWPRSYPARERWAELHSRVWWAAVR